MKSSYTTALPILALAVSAFCAHSAHAQESSIATMNTALRQPTILSWVRQLTGAALSAPPRLGQVCTTTVNAWPTARAPSPSFNGLSRWDLEAITGASLTQATVNPREGETPCAHPEEITAPLPPQSCALILFVTPSRELSLNVLIQSSTSSGGYGITQSNVENYAGPTDNSLNYGLLCNWTSAPSSPLGILPWLSTQYYEVPATADGVSRRWEPFFQPGAAMPSTSVYVARINFSELTSPYGERPYTSAYTPNSLVEVRRLDAVTRQEYSALYMQTSRGLDFLKQAIYPGDYLDDQLMARERHRVLDAGTGGAALVIDLQARGVDAYGIDLTLEDRVRTVPNVIEGDMTHMPYPDGFFHSIYSTYTIFTNIYESENTPLIVNALKEFARVLADGGYIRIAPFDVRSIDQLLARDLPELEITRRSTTPESGSVPLIEFRRRPRDVAP